MSKPRETPPVSLDEFRAMLDNVQDYCRKDKPPKGYSIIIPKSRRGRRAFAEMLKRMDAPLPSSRPCARLSHRTDRKP